MPTKAPRIYVPITPELMDALDEFTKVSGIAKSQILSQLMSDSFPPLVRAMTEAFRVAKKSPSQAIDVMREMVQEAHVGVAQLQLDMDVISKSVKTKKRKLRKSRSVIDWLKLRAPIIVTGKIPGDTVMLVSPDGEVKWSKVKAIAVRGSHDSNLHVSACPVSGRLLIDGNPAKFFQGHNVFGSDDIHGLAHALVRNVINFLELDVTDEFRELLDLDQIELSHVDITEMYSAGSQLLARASVRAIGEMATMKHRGRAITKEGTVYFGKHSRRSALKVYAKGDELRDHKLPDGLPQADEVQSFAADKLRFEVVLRGMELKHLGLSMLSDWTPETGVTLHREFVGRVNLPENIELPPDVIEGLSPRLQLAYSAWIRGDDLRVTLPKRTFYRYRAELLQHGIDIVSLRTAEAKSNVFPLRRVIELRPAGVPEWAKGTSLYFEPRRSA